MAEWYQKTPEEEELEERIKRQIGLNVPSGEGDYAARGDRPNLAGSREYLSRLEKKDPEAAEAAGRATWFVSGPKTGTYGFMDPTMLQERGNRRGWKGIPSYGSSAMKTQAARIKSKESSEKMTPRLEAMYQILRRTLPGASGAMQQSDINRGVSVGDKNPELANLPPEVLAQLDRYAWGAQNREEGGLGIVGGIGGIPAAVYSELVKIPALQGMLRPVTRGLGTMTGFGQAEDWYRTEPGVTSPPSLKNLRAYLSGVFRTPGPGLSGAFRRGR